MAKITMTDNILMTNGETKEYIFYDSEFNLFSQDKKRYIYNAKLEKDCRFYCNCLEYKVEINLCRKGEHYCFENYPDNKQEHKSTCNLHPNFNEINILDKGWSKGKYNGNHNDFSVNLDLNILNISTKYNTADETATYFTDDKGINFVTLLGLMIGLNIYTWNNSSPSHKIYDLMKSSYFLSSNITMGHDSNKDLIEYMYKYSRFKELKDEEVLFIYMPLVSVLKTKHPKYCNVVLGFSIKGNEKNLIINCPITLFDDLYKRTEIKPNYKKGDVFEFIVGGFIKKNKNGFAKFVSIEIMPISKQGLWVQNNYEKLVYDELVQKERTFFKGYKSVANYGGLIPNIILIDRKKVVYGEIFGVKDIAVCDDRRYEKIKLSTLPSSAFDFWYWYIDEEMISMDNKYPLEPLRRKMNNYEEFI